jgi:hypothetical protein
LSSDNVTVGSHTDRNWLDRIIHIYVQINQQYQPANI